MDTFAETFDSLMSKLTANLSFIRGVKCFLKEASKVHIKLSQAYDSNFSKIPTAPNSFCNSLIQKSQAFCYTLVEHSDQASKSASDGHSELKKISQKIKESIDTLRQSKRNFVKVTNLSNKSVEKSQKRLDINFSSSLCVDFRTSSQGILDTINSLVSDIEKSTNNATKVSLRSHFKSLFTKASEKVAIFGMNESMSRDSLFDNSKTIRQFDLSNVNYESATPREIIKLNPCANSSPKSKIRDEEAINSTHILKPPRHSKSNSSYIAGSSSKSILASSREHEGINSFNLSIKSCRREALDTSMAENTIIRELCRKKKTHN